MPSREEIVSWLRQAAVEISPDGIDPRYDVFMERAAQVSAMRCETCKWSDEPIVESVMCLSLDKRSNKNFGCFSHKPREGV